MNKEDEAVVRRIVAEALQALGREAEHQDDYDSDVIETTALQALVRSAEGAAKRLTCPHESYESWNSSNPSRTCRQCGEPEPEPENPFEAELEAPTGKTRQCPVDPQCAPIKGWVAFLTHVYEVHTDGDEAHRIEVAQRLLERGRPSEGEATRQDSVTMPDTVQKFVNALWRTGFQQHTRLAQEITKEYLNHG